MKLKLWRKYENLPYLETESALHVKKAGILEKVEIRPTDRAWCIGTVDALTRDYLDLRAGATYMRGWNVVAGVFALLCAYILVRVLTQGLLPDVIELHQEGSATGAEYLLLAFAVLGTILAGAGAVQALLSEARPVRDFQYRLNRKTGKLHEWWGSDILESNFGDLTPCYHRIGIGTAATGSFVLADLDRKRQVVRRLYHMRGHAGSDALLSQWGWEYLRRYMAGEFDRLPVMPQAAPLQSGFAGIARDFAPARWGRTLIARLGPLGYLLAFPLIVVVGLLTGLPWLYTTLADLRLTLPDWSRIEQADSGTAASPPLEHLLERDPQFEAQQRIAAWEAPLYGVVMVCGSALWLVLISWMFNWIHSAFAR